MPEGFLTRSKAGKLYLDYFRRHVTIRYKPLRLIDEFLVRWMAVPTIDGPDRAVTGFSEEVAKVRPLRQAVPGDPVVEGAEQCGRIRVALILIRPWIIAQINGSVGSAKSVGSVHAAVTGFQGDHEIRCPKLEMYARIRPWSLRPSFV